jgi:hypothetical protein
MLGVLAAFGIMGVVTCACLFTVNKMNAHVTKRATLALPQPSELEGRLSMYVRINGYEVELEMPQSEWMTWWNDGDEWTELDDAAVHKMLNREREKRNPPKPTPKALPHARLNPIPYGNPLNPSSIGASAVAPAAYGSPKMVTAVYVEQTTRAIFALGYGEIQPRASNHMRVELPHPMREEDAIAWREHYVKFGMPPVITEGWLVEGQVWLNADGSRYIMLHEGEHFSMGPGWEVVSMEPERFYGSPIRYKIVPNALGTPRVLEGMPIVVPGREKSTVSMGPR